MTGPRARQFRRACVLGTAAVVSVVAVAASSPGQVVPGVSWAPYVRVKTVVDVAGPRSDGTFVVASAGRLSLLTADGILRPFARGAGGYATSPNTEPYLTVSPDQALDGADCAFHRDELYVLEPTGHPAVVVVDPHGLARHAVSLPAGDFLNGITFDTVGGFGHRLLVTARTKRGTALFAIDCDGQARTITVTGPRVEGGIAVAPATFGAYAGDLIAPDELSGRIVAFDPSGGARTLAVSGLPTGGDVGVESAGFVPAAFGPTWSVYLADRGTPGNPHPGTDHLLRVAGSTLLGVGVQAGDLLVATEGGAQTVAVRCAATCTVRHVVDGAGVTHGEGHLVFVPGP